MVKLPTPGGDDDIWGDLLNDFLEVSLDNANVDENERGKLKPSAVSEAGAVMETDTTTAAMQFVVDEDNMASNSATKVPTQQSVKAYVDTKETKAKVTPIAVSTATAAATAAKVGTTVGGTYTPALGDIIAVTFTTANTATSPTINIDGSGAKSILLGNVNPTAVAMAGTKALMWYDGTAFQLFGSQRVSDTDTNTTYVATTAFTTVSGTTQSAAVNAGYIANNAAEVNVRLPATAAIGQIVVVIGLGTGGWRVTAQAGDDIMLEGNSTGAAGYIFGGQYASVSLRCIVANATWEVVDYTGNITTGVGYSTAKQPLDADLTALAAAGNSTILAATTASFLAEDKTKLDGIEALADVTDATNVAAAGAVMEADTTTAAMGFVVDEDDMVSNSATKIPTQQSVKAYADTKAAIADVVKLTGNQTIAGEKTFSNRSYFLDTLAIHTPDNSPTGGGVGTWAVANIASTMYFSNRSASPDLIFGASSEGGTIGLGSGDAAVDAYIKHGGTHRLLFSGGGDDSDTIRISNITDPTDAQDAVTKNYVDNSTISSNLTGNVAYRNAGLANWFTALETAHTTARNIVVIGDSIASLTSWWATKPWPWRLADLMTTHGRTPPAEATFRFAVGANMLTMTSCDGTQKSPEIGMGGWAAELTNGQKATQTAVMDGISVVYTTSPGAGSIEVRDGVGGTLLTTINTDAAAKSSNIWTSNSLSLASHTIELTSIGTTILEGVYVHNGTRNKGVRVWSASHSGYTTSQMYSNPSFALDLIDNLNPDLVIIATGTNDGAANYATYMAGMISAVQGVTSADIAIWLPYTSSVGFPAAEDAAARAYLSTVDLPIIDAGYGIPNMGARFTPDGVHPAGDTGHTLIANHVFASIGGDPIGQTANQLGLLEIDLTTKAPLENPTFTGQVTLPNQFTYANGNLFAGNIFGQPTFGMKDTGNAASQIGLSTSSINQALLGINQPSLILGAGSGAPDANLFRNDVGEFRIRTATTSETGNIVFAKKFNNQTGTSYTLALTDEGKIVTMNNGAANTLSLPQDSAAAFTIGAEIPIINYGAGTTTIQAGTGATLVGGGMLLQNERKVVTKVAANTWHVSNASADFLIDEDNMASNLDTKAPTQQSTKAYVDNAVTVTEMPGALPYHSKYLSNWLTKLKDSNDTGPLNIVVVGDSIAASSSTDSPTARGWGWLMSDLFARKDYLSRYPDTPDVAQVAPDGWTPALASWGKTMTYCEGSATNTGLGRYSSTMSNGQVAYHTTTLDAVSVVYNMSPTGGQIEVRDGAGGTLLTTIETNGTAVGAQMWTSSALTYGSHTVHLTAVCGVGESVVLNGVYCYSGNLTRGIRVWPAARAGISTDTARTDTTFFLDFIDTIDPDLVVLATGANDDVADYTADMQALIDDTKARTSADIALWGCYPITRYAKYLDSQSVLARNMALSNNLQIIDAFLALPDMKQGLYFRDNLHPNDNGAKILAWHAYSILSGDPLGFTMRELSTKAEQSSLDTLTTTVNTKAPINNPTFTGTITGNLTGNVTGAVDLSYGANGSIKISSVFGYPGLTLNNNAADTQPAIGFTSAGFASLIGYGTNAVILFGPGGSSPIDAGLARTAASELTFYGATSSTKSNVAVADPTSAAHAATKSYVDTRNHQIVAKESGQYYSMQGTTTASTLLTMTASGVLTSHPVFLQAGSYDQVSVITTVAAVSTWRFGVYPSDPATGRPDGQSLILDCGTIDMNATAGFLTATISLTIPTTGVYWVAGLVDSYTATPTVHGWTTAAATAQLPLLGSPVNSTAGTAGRNAIARTLTGVATGSMPATYPTSSWSHNAPRISLRAT